MNSNKGSRRKFVRWLGISSILIVIALIGIGISAAIFFVNLNPGFDNVMYSDPLMCLLLVHVGTLVLPMLFIVLAITRLPPFNLTAGEDRIRTLVRATVPLLLIIYGAFLTYEAFTCKTIKVNKPGLGMLFVIASFIQPLIWFGIGVALNYFRTASERQGRFFTGISSICFLLVGLMLVVVLVLQQMPDLTTSLVPMILPPVACLVLVIGMISLFAGVQYTRAEFSGYLNQ